jgi:hypothetical protein
MDDTKQQRACGKKQRLFISRQTTPAKLKLQNLYDFPTLPFHSSTIAKWLTATKYCECSATGNIL